MIFKKLSVVWKVNPRLKSSVKYKKSFFNLVVEVPEFIAEKTSEEKTIIIEYINLKRQGKRIPSVLKKRFSEMFPVKHIRQKKYDFDEAHFSLSGLLCDNNMNYFKNTCDISAIYWTSHPSKRILGRYFDSDRSISITSYLNQRSVPEYVIKYIIYHEMCHQMFPPYSSRGKRSIHHKEFKEAERKYESYDEAKKWIKNNIK
jgi:hypothetical protein